MQKKFRLSLFIFRRDLRLADNTGLLQACAQSENVLPCFIIDDRQVGDGNRYRSFNCMQFMAESLDDLSAQLEKKHGKLYVFTGIAEDVVKQLIQEHSIDAVFVNKDYTPFSRERDKKIEHVCTKNGVQFVSFDDLLLHAPEETLKSSGEPYTVFTPFFRNAYNLGVREPQKFSYTNFFTKKSTRAHVVNIHKHLVPYPNSALHIQGGTQNALAIVNNIAIYSEYSKTRDYPALSTTNLSAHHKFGTVSLRTVYAAIVDQLGSNHPLLRQLYWRDFYTTIAYYFPHVYGHAFNPKYEDLSWNNNLDNFKRWCEGSTGFPIVDAGMRQLTTTGFMHNRVRMIVGSFLTKDLHISWRWGEQFFARQLLDYDPAVNNGNWQWVASTGCDPQPYFRIFNPWLGQAKFDPDCEYIKRWIPELKTISSKEIHTWYKNHNSKVAYPKPMVDHGLAREKALALYKAARAR